MDWGENTWDAGLSCQLCLHYSDTPKAMCGPGTSFWFHEFLTVNTAHPLAAD